MSDDGADGNSRADQDDRINLLEAALLEYIERYGLTRLAEAAMTTRRKLTPDEN